ncbi:M81 family peptidase [Rhodovarius crocodyli]|uniref:Microcystinase C n=1 Tax=Rhodovarius crocodyli TaxID=1979269 RepID=A0A437MEJ2_9PROT|nr:M81 family metallopeptidase [Rhodovarius crocodyli]RVT96081.1 M81 family peptidase [Rhodovarius crocodyli]
MRVAIGGFQHESHSFAPLPTRYRDFIETGGFPSLQHPETLLDNLRGSAMPTAGAIAAAEEAGCEIAPLAWGFANPAGPVTREAFERITALIVAALSRALDAGPLDGVFLELHGAMVSDDFPDAEGEILRRVRAVVGPEVPITASLDPHCNMTALMTEMADALVPYRTYPHVDMKFAGAQAMRLLLRRAKGEGPWKKAHRVVDFLLPITSQCTMVEPMQGVMDTRAAIEAEYGVAELAYCFGFPYADFPGCGQAISAFGERAQEAADAFLAAVNAKESAFQGGVLPAEEAVAEAIRISSNAARPVVLADTQDNPGGGGHGDTTGLLAELIRQDAQGAALAIFNDARSAAACHAAGEGATLRLTLGGASGEATLEVTATVEKLTDGKYTLSGPMGGGNRANLGPSARIRVAPGVQVVLTSLKMQAHDQEAFRSVGIEPAEMKIVAVKSSVHFRAHFQPIAEKVIVAVAPGPVVADPATLPFTNLRPDLRLRPGDNRTFGG